MGRKGMAMKEQYYKFRSFLHGIHDYHCLAIEGQLPHSYPNGVPDETVKEWIKQRVKLRKLAFEYAVTVVPEPYSEQFLEVIAETLGTGC
jgi:hypothetical protein